MEKLQIYCGHPGENLIVPFYIHIFEKNTVYCYFTILEFTLWCGSLWLMKLFNTCIVQLVHVTHIYNCNLHWQLITFRNKLKWFELPWYGILLDTVETVELPPLTSSKFILTGCEVQYPCRYLQQHSSLTERSSVYMYVVLDHVDECLYKKYMQWSHICIS